MTPDAPPTDVPRPWPDFWSRLRSALTTPKRIGNWTRDGLIRNGDFDAVSRGNTVYVELDNGNHRVISESEMRQVYRVWEAYMNGRMSRGAIVQKMNIHNSKYIISIMHQFKHLM